MWRNLLAPVVGAMSFYGDLILLGEYVGRRGATHVTVAAIWAVALAVALYLVWWISSTPYKMRLTLAFGAALILLATGLSTAKVADRISRGALVEPMVFLKAGSCLVVLAAAFAFMRWRTKRQSAHGLGDASEASPAPEPLAAEASETSA